MQLEGPRSVAAVILEPVPGANGVIVPPADYWPTVRRACDAEGALLIADEVLTGFGRTGAPFGFQHWDVMPDLITVAKGLGVGLPGDRRGDRERQGRPPLRRPRARVRAHVLMRQDPTACAAALETLKLYDDDKLFDNARRLGPVLRRELDTIAGRVAGKTFVRGLGLLAVLEVEADAAAWATLGRELVARKLSLHVDGKRGTAIFAPPLCIAEAELVAGMRSFGEAALAAFGGTS